MSELYMKSYKVLERIKTIGLIISGVSLFTMMLFIVADVLGRNFLSQSIPGNFEIVINYFLPLSVFTAMPYAYGIGVLPRITMVLDRFSDKIRKNIIIGLLLFEVILFSLIIYYSAIYAITGTVEEFAFPAGGNLYPYYFLLYLVPLSFFLVIIEIVFLIIKNVKGDTSALIVAEKKVD
ncbi:TRAP transporter small permease [Oceanobacillus longus]|uniref:TRAP transporter small permease n=1 Tax=Oceanobacillus longus TaxID=930120 RepID=A0ABV8GZT5_9BACI